MSFNDNLFDVVPDNFFHPLCSNNKRFYSWCALELYEQSQLKRTSGYIRRSSIIVGADSIDQYKLFFTTSYSTNVINTPEAIKTGPGEICTETFLVVGPFATELEMNNCYAYFNTNFFKTLLYFGKGTMQVTKSVFGLIPSQDFTWPWTDAELYKKYNLFPDEIALIEELTNSGVTKEESV